MDETFFAAQRRHRRSARLYSALAATAALAQGLPAAVMLAPFTIAVAVLSADVLNLVRPTPDLALLLAERLQPPNQVEASSGGSAGSASPAAGEATSVLVEILVVSAVPGLLMMVLLWWFVRRFMLRDGLGGVLVSAGARPADTADAEEHQLVNIVEEIALAAGIQSPRVLVLPAEVPNAAAFGRSPDRSTVAVSRGLLDALDRDATQGVAAHLVASVANGDLRMRHSLLAVFLAYALAADLLCAPFARSSRRRLGQAWRMLRGKGGAEGEALAIRSLLGDDDSDNLVVALTFLTWKLVQFYTNLFLVGGLLALPFRSRRYLADATAVQLARTPDGLGRALIHLHHHGRHLPGAEFAAIYTIASPDPKVGDDGLEDAVTLPASLHPPMHKRVGRLRRLGFRGTLQAPARGSQKVREWPWPLRWLAYAVGYTLMVVLLGPLLVLLALTVTSGVLLSVMLGLLFFGAVAAAVTLPLHAILRGVA